MSAPLPREPGSFRVGVFEHEGRRKTRLVAYVRWYNPTWPGCCEHVILADNGTDAKKAAMEAHRQDCMEKRRPRGRGGYR